MRSWKAPTFTPVVDLRMNPTGSAKRRGGIMALHLHDHLNKRFNKVSAINADRLQGKEYNVDLFSDDIGVNQKYYDEPGE